MKNNLRALRNNLGLTQKELAAKSNVPLTFLCKLERDELHVDFRYLRRFYKYVSYIQRFLAQHNLKLAGHFEHSDLSPSLEYGKTYNITNNNRINNRITGSKFEKEGTFIYVGRQGKHHVFKSVRGGWSRTYTDAH